jgi:Co/Zn/Cd efflux system component
MADCCEDKSCEVSVLRVKHARILKTVLAINALMFFVEASSGYLAGSTALLGDSLDMLGDALAYGTSLYVLGKGAKLNAMAASFKGLIMAFLGLSVLVQAIYKILHPSIPAPYTMGTVGLMALTANAICLVLLWKSRSDDLNMHSVWLCSRNDIVANAGVLAAALGVRALHNIWPDVLVGLVIAGIFIRSSLAVLQRAFIALKPPRPAPR